MKRTLKTLLPALTLALVQGPAAFAYIGETFTTTGGSPQTIQITRPDAANLSFYLNSSVVAGVKSSLSGLTVVSASSNPTGAVQAAMATWNNVGSANIHFNTLQSTTAARNSSDCQNVISIAGNSADLSVLGFVSASSPGVIAVTVNAFLQSAGTACGGSTSVPAGTILDSDILLNPYRSFSTDSTTGTQDIQAVLTHEFGHMLGMNHSPLLAATMYPFVALYHRHLSWDEKAFAAAYYPAGSKSLGSISGTVTLGSSPVKYGLVTLTDVSGGGKTISSITGADGTYSVQVPPGVYNVYAEPFNSFIGATNIYSLTSPTQTIDPTQATTDFGATFSGGNSNNPPVFTITGSSSSATANISVTSGATPLTQPFFTLLPGGVLGIPGGTSFNTIVGAIPLSGGQTYDLVFAGPGIDSTITVAYIGTNVTINGSPRVDPAGVVNGNPIIRQQITVGSQSNSAIGSIWIVKGTNVLPFSGVLDLEPSVPVISNVLDAESFRTSIVSGQYVAIYGNNLGNNTRTWNANTDFTGGVAAGNPLPTSLDGVSVTVNSLPAAVFFTSPSQINFIAPTGLTPGTATVVVTNQGTASTAYTKTNVAQASPSFFQYFAGGNYYPSGVRLSTLKTIGDPAALPGSEKALPGDTLILFGNGLGPSPGGVIATVASFTGPVTITGVSGSNSFTATAGAALVYAGEFQINLTLPTPLPAGNYALSMSVPNGSTSTAGLTITLPVGP